MLIAIIVDTDKAATILPYSQAHATPIDVHAAEKTKLQRDIADWVRTHRDEVEEALADAAVQALYELLPETLV